MNTCLPMFALIAVLVATVGMAPAFGQAQGPITVTTDKESYVTGETITVSGEVSQKFGFAVAVKVIAPNGNLVTIEQLTVGADKMFNTTLTAGGALMKQDGTYTIHVQYGDSSNRSAETTFEFTGGEIPIRTPVDDGNIVTDDTIRVEDSTDLISYLIEGGQVVGVRTEQPGTLIISIEATDDGMITLTIPKSVFDAVDDDIFVFVDGEESEFEETDITETQRTLMVQFPAGAEEIEIIGTFVIPEFGAIAAMILAVAIISIIAVSARSRLSIMPRY